MWQFSLYYFCHSVPGLKSEALKRYGLCLRYSAQLPSDYFHSYYSYCGLKCDLNPELTSKKSNQSIISWINCYIFIRSPILFFQEMYLIIFWNKSLIDFENIIPNHFLNEKSLQLSLILSDLLEFWIEYNK